MELISPPTRELFHILIHKRPGAIGVHESFVEQINGLQEMFWEATPVNSPKEIVPEKLSFYFLPEVIIWSQLVDGYKKNFEDALESNIPVVFLLTLPEEKSQLEEVTSEKLRELLPTAAVRIAAPTINPGETIPVLIEKRRPLVWLFLGESGSGKSNAAMELASATGLPLHTGDGIVQNLALHGKIEDENLKIQLEFALEDRELSRAISHIFETNQENLLLNEISTSAKNQSLIVDLWVPEEYEKVWIESFEKLNFKAILCNPASENDLVSRREWLRIDVEEVKKERELLIKQRDTIRKERDELELERDELFDEKVELGTQLNRAQAAIHSFTHGF